jgi:hypothetical protein
MELFQLHQQLTHHAMIRLYRARYDRGSVQTAESTIRTRCAELVDLGRIRDSGRRTKVGSRDAIIWEVNSGQPLSM